MPRDGGGIYTLPAGNPVVPETIIETDWANPTMQDIGVALSDSLSRSGKGGMTASLRGPDGSAAVPTFSFTNETNTGRYRAGPGQVIEVVLGQPVVRYLSTGLEQWDGGAWVPLTPRDALGTPFDPGPSNLTSINVQDAIEEVNDKIGGVTTADSVSYDDSLVYFPAATVQIALDRLGIDLSAVAGDVSQNAADITLNAGNIVINTNSILANIDAINANSSDIGVLNTRVDNVETTNDTQDGRLDTAELDIIQIEGDITSLESDVGSLNTRVTNNENNIQDNSLDIITLESYFTGGVCEVSHGGTGVTSKTGSGSVVLNSSPYITGGTIENLNINNVTGGGFFSLGNNATAQTKGNADNDTSVATTAFVHSLVGAIDIGATQDHGSNGNGSYARIGDKNGTPRWVLQWGNALNGNTGNRSVSFPISFPDAGNVRVMMQQYGSAIAGGRDWAPTISSLGSSSFTYGASYDCIWFAIGRDQ